MKFVFADVETTGIKPTDKVCEVAWVKVDSDLNVVERGCSLINPGIPIPADAAAIHGIRDIDVKDAPTIEEYMESVGYPLMGEDVVMVAHNAPFDYGHLKAFMSDGAVYLDTLRCARILYPDAPNHKQGTLAVYLGFDLDRSKAHSADGDLDVLISLVARMCSDEGKPIEHLMDVQKRKRLITAMPFGKHKGLPLRELPRNYVQWLLKEANIDDDLRASLLMV